VPELPTSFRLDRVSWVSHIDTREAVSEVYISVYQSLIRVTQALAHIRIIGVHHDRYPPLLAIVVQLERPFRDVKREVDWVRSELDISRSKATGWNLCVGRNSLVKPTDQDFIDIPL
jgi:hypothetical protein